MLNTRRSGWGNVVGKIMNRVNGTRRYTKFPDGPDVPVEGYYYRAGAAGFKKCKNGHSVTALRLQKGSIRGVLTQGGHSRNLFKVTDLPEMGT